jgi:MFS transporter, FSR family, fosmidomycin resistance protein
MNLNRNARVGLGFLGVMLAIEFLDELVDGVGGAAWPPIRDALNLSYLEIGLLLSVPGLIATLVEPAIWVLSDTLRRRTFVLIGGLGFGISLLLTGVAGGFLTLLVSFIVFYPSSGAFVSLSQASLADADPERLEQNMSRWALAGSAGNLLGPVLIGLTAGIGLGWRPVYIGMAILTALLLVIVWRSPDPPRAQTEDLEPGLVAGFRRAFTALRRSEVRRWLLLLEAANLMLDVLRGYIALYFVDVVRTSQGTSSLALAVFTGVGFLGDALLLPLLERVSGIAYLRVSALVTLGAFTAFLVAPLEAKFVLLGVLGLSTPGWYSILQARLYASLPGQSGTALALGNVSGLIGSLVPLALGGIAQGFGLEVAMWSLLLGPVALIFGLPRRPRTS